MAAEAKAEAKVNAEGTTEPETDGPDNSMPS